MDDQETLADRIQHEVTEIAEVLARQQRTSVREVWTEALTLHRCTIPSAH